MTDPDETERNRTLSDIFGDTSVDNMEQMKPLSDLENAKSPCHYQILYNTKYKTYVESVLANSEIATQLKLQSRQLLDIQVQDAVALLQRVLKIESEHHSGDSSPIEKLRRPNVLNFSSPTPTITPNASSNWFSHQLSRRKLSRRKRSATSSGKKGLHQKRTNVQSDSLSQKSFDEFSVDQTSFPINQEWEEQSFSLQQSPILLPIRRKSLLSGISPISQQQQGWDSPLTQACYDSSTSMDDTLLSPNCTIQPRKTRNHLHLLEHEEERTPSYPSLQMGSFFHLQPLQIQQRQKKLLTQQQHNHSHKTNKNRLPLHDFFKPYGPRLASRLRKASEWLLSQDSGSIKAKHKPTAALILNTTHNQTSSLLLHTLAINGTHHKHKSSSYTSLQVPLSNNSNIPGGTLIVVRTKDDLIFWERMFREQTSYSILNHAAIPAKSRRRVADTATKCTYFDVVLTTFDAIKSKEVPIAVDCKGRAVNPNTNGRRIMPGQNTSHPWYTSRHAYTEKTSNMHDKENQSLNSDDDDDDDDDCESIEHSSRPPTVKVLSVLHGIRWSRLVFVDTLEKSYITNHGARSDAAISFHGLSRILFLMQPILSSETKDYVATLKESHKQLLLIARALDLNPKTAAQDVVGRFMLDVSSLSK